MSISFEWQGDSPHDIAEAFREANRNLPDELESAADDIGTRLRGAAQGNAPVDDGPLRATLTYETDVGGLEITVRVGSPIHYAPDVEYGTAPHTITPKDAEVLVFEIEGETVFTKRVEHPGTEPQPFLRPAFNDNIQWIKNRLNRAVANAYDDAGFNVTA